MITLESLRRGARHRQIQRYSSAAEAEYSPLVVATVAAIQSVTLAKVVISVDLRRPCSAHCGHDKLCSCPNAGGPPRRDRLQLSIEPDALRPMHVMIAEQGGFPASK